MTIKFISATAVLPLRSLVLREGKPYALCQFDEDDRPDTIHLAVVDDDEQPRCILTAFPKACEGFDGLGYQLRGMATHPAFQGRGLGAALVSFLIGHLREQAVSYIWCNARKLAFPFYEKLGFGFLSPEFDVAGIGPHRSMYLQL